MNQPECIERLANEFSKLPGVGKKTAQRYAYAVVEWDKNQAAALSDAIAEVKEKVGKCEVCGNYSETPVCEICLKRDKSVICVVSYPKDVLAMERVSGFSGVYHVLGGVISPIDGVFEDDLNIAGLIKRLDGVREVIIATNPDVKGEATAYTVAKRVKEAGVKVTRLAQGISMGSEVEYADEATLARAIQSRTEM
ncbi:MAG: recombination mediator RecR [Firmicutes bacterium]|nr:recombination mediator RecR [Bacillota bacterium]MDY5531687.1 recombination mediator RecR [Pumilibacteraceae bacterium]